MHGAIKSSFLKQEILVHNVGELFFGMCKVYDSAKNSLNTYIFNLLLFFAIPLIWISLLHIFRKLKKSFSEEIVIDASNYRDWRLKYDILTKADEKISHASSKQTSFLEIPLIYRGIVKLVLKIDDLFLKRKDQLEAKLNKLNAYAPETYLFNSLSEAELWEHRTKAYEYRF